MKAPKYQTIFINPPSKNKRMLIRNFDCATESKGNYLYQPYDFLLLSSHFKEDQFMLIDAIAESIEISEVFKRVENVKFKCLIIALADTNWDEDFDFLRETRRRYPEATIYVFGDSFIEKKCTKKS